MKKPWVIGLLSIVPGLGLIVLGEIRKGLGLFLLTILPFLLLFVPSESVIGIGVAIGLTVWGTQGYYAVVLAQRRARVEAGSALPVRQVAIAPEPPGASSGEKLLHQASQTVMQLLPPGKHLRVALQGATGVPSTASALFGVAEAALGGVPSTSVAEQVYLGIAEQDFILVKTDAFGQPCDLERIPLTQVSLVKSSEGVLADEVVIDMGGSQPLRVSVGGSMREGTRQLIGILSGRELDHKEAVEPVWQGRTLDAGDRRPGLAGALSQGLHLKHPILVTALLGAAGGIAGTVIAAALAIVMGLVMLGAGPSSGYAEGLGYAVGLYCLVMFPLGGGFLGAIPGAIVGALRNSRGRELAPLPPLLAGFLTVLLLTLALVAVLVLFG